MSATSPSDRSQIARMGAYAQHKQYDVKETTRAANSGFKAKFLREADPEGKLPEIERERRAEAAFKEHMTRLAYRSAQARRKRKKLTDL